MIFISLFVSIDIRIFFIHCEQHCSLLFQIEKKISLRKEFCIHKLIHLDNKKIFNKTISWIDFKEYKLFLINESQFQDLKE